VSFHSGQHVIIAERGSPCGDDRTPVCRGRTLGSEYPLSLDLHHGNTPCRSARVALALHRHDHDSVPAGNLPAVRRPFVKVHHLFAAAGLLLATIHPVLLAIALVNFALFIPLFGSLYGFLAAGGRVALIILWVVFVAAVFQAAIPKYWRPIHALMYLVIIS
jgi:hypothetical protein